MWLAAALLACVDDPGSDPAAEPPYTSEVYGDPAHWLCRPDLEGDTCDGDLDVTEVHADGSTTVVPHVPAADPAADCLYIYPTNSLDPTPNADWAPGSEEPWITEAQAARYGRACRVFAPLYRQVTVTGLVDDSGDWELAYADVLDAFRHWQAHDVGDRPFLLIGHSQGSIHLERLIAEEIEPDPALHDRLVAAHLIGGFVATADGEDVGGSFADTPSCAAPDQTGCVVHFNAYQDDAPPGDDPFFSLPEEPGERIVCTHPGALETGTGPLLGAFLLDVPPEVLALVGVQLGPYADPADTEALTTRWYRTPGLLSGACTEAGEASWLSVTVEADPDDPRVDDIGGELIPGWGLHLVDMALAQEDLVSLAESQIAAH